MSEGETPRAADEADAVRAHKAAEPAERPERIVFLRDLCVRTFGGACERCLLACPYDAIEFDADNVAHIDDGACTRCGLCLGVCDAFTSTRVTVTDLHARVRRVVVRDETPVIACTRCFEGGFDPAANVVEVPCLATLPPELWTLMQVEGLDARAYVDFGLCDDCVRAGDMAVALMSHAFAEAERISGRAIPFCAELPAREQLVHDAASERAVDRRALFGTMAGDVADITSGRRRVRNSAVLQQFYEQRERARASARLKLNESPELNRFAPQGTTHRVMFPKRRLLLETIDRNPSAADRVGVALSRTDDARCVGRENRAEASGRDETGDVAVLDTPAAAEASREPWPCDIACAKRCPTGARSPHPQDGSLSFDVRYCIGCGICLAACPHAAIDLEETTAAALVAPCETER